VDTAELSTEARKQLKKIKKLTRKGLLYDENYTKRKKETHDDLSEDSDSEKNTLIVLSQSQPHVLRSESFEEEFLDVELAEADEADTIDVRPIKTIEEILDVRYIEEKAQYFVKWQHLPDGAGEWCTVKIREPALKKYLALSAQKRKVRHIHR